MMIVPVDGDTPALLDRLKTIRSAGDVPLVGDARWPSALWQEISARASAADVPSSTAWATLTSGSSGSPRIVLRTSASWADSFGTVASLLEAGTDDVVALPAPPSASLTLFSLAHALADGPRPALGSPVQSGVTCLHGTPQALRAVLDAGPPSALKAALVGGSHLDEALADRARAAGIRLTAYYGAAELSFVAVDQGDGLRPFPGVELSIRKGVLWVQSPFVASGYVGAGGPLRHENGWATVGDRAEFREGRLRLLGRGDDAILSASATIVPEEIEEVLRSIPAVVDAVVFGLPQERIGFLVGALVELADDADLSQVREFARGRLLPAHMPRQWFAGRLPRTSSGKPARQEAVRRVMAKEVPRIDV